MNRSFKYILEQILTLGQSDFFRTVGRRETDILRVAAGDPSLPISQPEKDVKIPETIVVDEHEINVKDYTIYEVSGNSMSPKDIQTINSCCQPLITMECCVIHFIL